MFGRATVALGIGPHSICSQFFLVIFFCFQFLAVQQINTSAFQRTLSISCVISYRVESYRIGTVTKSNAKELQTRTTATVHILPPRHVWTRIRICIPIRGPYRHQNLVICSSHCQPSAKISFKSVRKLFLRIVANKQTNNDDYITSSVEVIRNE